VPLIEQIEINSASRLGVWEIEEEADRLKWLLQWGKEDIRRFQELKDSERGMHWLASRVLLRKMLNTPEFIDLRVDEYGKPYLKNFPQQISISHSEKRVAVITSENLCGIDIQHKDHRIEKIASKFISKEEWQQFEPDNKLEQIHLIWGAKEAMYKVYGRRKLDFKDSLFVEPFVFEEKGRLKGHIEKGSYFKDLILNYEWKDDYMLVWTVDNSN
jgi:4'-phosphopantetheinyl transferase